jgi:hypothetical protein
MSEVDAGQPKDSWPQSTPCRLQLISVSAEHRCERHYFTEALDLVDAS